MKRWAVFLDRDGTINVEKNYVHRVQDWEWIPGAPEAIRLLNSAGATVLVVTNQAGIARGLYDQDAVRVLHEFVSDDLEKFGARIDGFYFCPHHPEYGSDRVCSCRKPLPGLIYEAAKDWNLDLSRSYLVGDKRSDIEAATAACVKPILVLTGYGSQEATFVGDDVLVVPDVLEAVKRIVAKVKLQSAGG